jgi:hypothetical protein
LFIKKGKFFALTLLASLLLLAVLNFNMINVQAQGQANVNVLPSVGGTTNPVAGNYTYNDGESVNFTATPVTDISGGTSLFQQWIIITDQGSRTSTDNPLTFPVTGGITYNIQAIFQPIQPVTSNVNMATAAIIIVLAGAGGTTSPVPGTYALADATSLDLTATPDSGWQFSHWVIAGPNLSHGGYPYTATPTDNPYNVNHGYGNTYSYQPVFVPTGTTEPTPTPTATSGGIMAGITTDTAIIIALIVVIIVILIAFGIYAARRRK